MSADSITAITKLIYEAKALGVHFGVKSFKIDVKSDKRFLDQCKETFQKIAPREVAQDSVMQDEISQMMVVVGDEFISNSLYEGSTKESKKPPEVLQIEDEYNALTGYDLVLRRGRCGRYFAKYVQKSIFEDCDLGTGNSDGEEDGGNNDKNISRKRRKRYYDLEEYLHGDGVKGINNF